MMMPGSPVLFKFSGVSPVNWHAHEMIFGYALATVSGFLLTAVLNWTHQNTASGKPLALVFILWLAARIGFIVDLPLEWVAILDLGFTLGLFLLFFIPIYIAKEWKQLGLASKFLLLVITNTLFYANSLDLLPASWGDIGKQTLIASLFLVLAINITMLRRLTPFFTEKALGLPAFKASKLLDGLSLFGFFFLLVAIVFLPNSLPVAILAFSLGLVHVIRLKSWYHAKIWSVILLWPLHVSYAFFALGMFLYGFVNLHWLDESIALHSLAAGGVGLLCSSILARISLGHSNRNVFNPPKGVVLVFILLTITALIRIIMPVISPEHYTLWINLSQGGWLISFTLLSILYFKILAWPPEPKHNGNFF